MHFFEPPRPALVLGSSQSNATVDYAECERRGIEVVRRRSGGGAVLVVPGACVWIDLWLPRTDPLWDDDVSRAMWWVGDLWSDALAQLGIEAHTHRAAMIKPSVAELCFTGVGPGEVLDPTGRKLVGVSARRSREGARFQTLAHTTGPATDWVGLLGLGSSESAALAASSAAVERDPTSIAALLAR